MSHSDKAQISGDPFRESDYFAAAEPDMQRHWDYYIWPYLAHFDRSCVLDLACGHGRNTARLLEVCDRVIAADINAECIDACRKRFGATPALEYLQLDGSSLRSLRAESLSLVYCWDAMVHFEPEVVASYVAEFARTLRPGGHGFIHHSNRMNDAMVSFQSEPHWRNYLSKDLFRYFVRTNGLVMITQRVIGWDESLLAEQPFASTRDAHFVPELDCLSVFQKPE